ncbi:polysaccharide biosynthesis protein [Clostridium perfringens]|uniref:polysaccharide biosynthesis protein n=3 Tax=Clostridium perfringens TaxID=1502 RepID=UPI0011065FD4|nr:nucleoside-diphosphate sugar epimerase/dehydratase [Clostridium perfringens]EIF2086632.1 polysaccharide biosynthesis protein [Clostridium perfringens]ELC8332495.1 polysaccharide biosynthesis protein [Clostridium perfringens]ELC8344573.1 polysaccharide biosynthesis protein [Clostridium perfringens]KAF2783074.1 nucleoside-diphosphate sugar epimerase [Clostridium perfringens]MBI6023279.1 polysaccharide biosynthesis protein [Clostridium perfringens]
MNSVRKIKCLFLIFLDILFINLGYFISLCFEYGKEMKIEYFFNIRNLIILAIFTNILIFCFFNLYKNIWHMAGISECIRCLIASSISSILLILYKFIFNMDVTIVFLINSSILICMFSLLTRMSIRIFRKIYFPYKLESNLRKNVLIVGAGHCGRIVIDEMNKNNKFNPIGIVDDDLNKKGTFLNGVKVLGNRDDIEKICKRIKVDIILIAISNLSSNDKDEIIKRCENTKIKVKIIPSIYDLIDGNVKLTNIRDIDLRDLLGRDETRLDKEEVNNYIKEKIVIVTGGGGSIGSELCRQIAVFNPKKLIILDIYENYAYELENELKRNFKNLDLEVIIASIRDKSRLKKIFDKYKPDLIFHAAAHKHVPLMENNPEEAIKNNVLGTLNVAECADEFNLEKFVFISTDKAVNPTNIMGATKRIGEMIIQAMNEVSKTDFVAVRFGNVLGSNGSVIPLFIEQIKNGGPVTLTHKDITRYFMLIPEAAQLVLQAGAYAKGGEIFVLDMGKPVKIYDLTEKLIRLSGFEPNKDIQIKIVGLRPGEKLYEELILSEEELKKTKNEKIFILSPFNFDIKEIKKKIVELLNVALNEDKKAIKEKLKEIVKNYRDLEQVDFI